MDIGDQFTTKQAAKILGINLDQVSDYRRQRLFKTQGTGKRAHFTFEELVQLKIMELLRRIGIRLTPALNFGNDILYDQDGLTVHVSYKKIRRDITEAIGGYSE
jgi:hypothetical protein